MLVSSCKEIMKCAEGSNAGDMECNDGSGNSSWGNEGGNTNMNQDNNNNDFLGMKRR